MTDPRTIATEFPDFDIATLPDIPEGFDDVSWHNDAFPSWLDEGRGLFLMIDYADPSLSEYPSERKSGVAKRFLLARYDTDDASVQETLVQSDEWSEILAAIK